MTFLNIANYSFAKRTLDMAIAAAGIFVSAPLMAIVSLAIGMQMGIPIFFKQVRPGYKAKPFVMYKFRTMDEKRDPRNNLRPDAERLTSLGRFLRSTSLDEIPELINVLKGEMSIVGPRPLLMQYLERYTPEQARRHEVKPGITGWAQVNGRNAITWEQKFEHDVWYVDHASFWLDLKIIAITIWKILKREGISQQGHATAEEFFPQQYCKDPESSV
jgi:lipopolysaccharide/colanic/teichoic acid biosynthesis glycosyltransferase